MKNREFFMRRCLDLAKKGMGHVSPNPMVGCVIVLNGEIISEGHHQIYGAAHAEVNAIENVLDKSLLERSTLYVNLEPCAHFGKTPPCSDLIIKYKIPEVVIGCIDPYSEVSGKGIEKMKNSEVKVIVGVLEEESKKLNKRFFSTHERKTPYIILKWAESEDGFLSPLNQKEPFWMTSNESRKLTHKWRSEEDAILVGRITAEKDNPSLTVREVQGKNPIRIIIDKDLKLYNNLNLFNLEAKTIIFNDIRSEIVSSNQFIQVDFKHLIKNLLKELNKQKIQSLIVEGGKITLQSFIDSNMWDEARIFTANKLLSEGLEPPIIEGEIILKEEVGTDKLKIIINR